MGRAQERRLGRQAEMKAEGTATAKSRTMLEFFDCPKAWTLDDYKEEYPWLTAEAVKRLDKFPFDYGDIMEADGYFMDESAMCEMFMCEPKELEVYCLILLRKPWSMVHNSLRQRARASSIDAFREFAAKGNATAMTIMANGVMRLGAEDKAKSVTVKFVNDLGEEDS